MKKKINPALFQTLNEGRLVPAPFANEVFVLTRPKVGFELNGVQTRNGKCVLDPATSIFRKYEPLVWLDTQSCSSIAVVDLFSAWRSLPALEATWPCEVAVIVLQCCIFDCSTLELQRGCFRS
jgi:hypothetical protein